MSDEKPLRMQVAHALGWTDLDKDGYYRTDAPYYDTDWSATGPLIEKYQISLIALQRIGKYQASYSTEEHGLLETEQGDTPLMAVCNLILTLGKAGKL